MAIELTDEQQQQLLEVPENVPPRVVNPRTNEAFVLVPADVYEHLRSHMAGEFDPREAYPWVDQVMAADDANDPYLEKYQHFQRGKAP